ncbi:hypothetical protein Bpfe_026052 [Biomphalaria pfeifferi]|uniref:39S ribosomal protein L34, mitochondrial n=1 Tax=Biomphalaria pfeifferi TaxID=112525 RepID=A0AAD8EXX7_BIOPF|nr:hypothetical protein Bpfe_026052 [Biomphalaria pfeifferi]
MFSFSKIMWRTGGLSGVLRGQMFTQANQFSLRSICQLSSQITGVFSKNCFTASFGSVQPGLCKATHPQVVHQSIRTKNTGKRIYYVGSAWKRYNKHNIERRLTTNGGLEILWRKTLKGKHVLAAYERILPNTVDGRILPQHLFRFQKHPLTKNRLPKPGLY